MATMREILMAKLLQGPDKPTLKERGKEVLDALLMRDLSTRKLRRTVRFKGDAYEVACPNCDAEARSVFLTYADVMTVKCQECEYIETVSR
jgi:ribosomal protein S27E